MSLAAVAGQERALGRLKTYLKSQRLPPAFLFHGPPGVGKALAAREFAKALNCPEGKIDACDDCPSCRAADKGIDPDFKRVDAAYQAGLRGEEEAKQRSLRIDTLRHLIRDLEMRSLAGRWKVAVLEDAHRLVPDAANAMLKSLEEPPPRTLWILVTHRPDELLGTVRSRCQRVPFARLGPEALERLLAARGTPPEAAAGAAAQAEGSLGRALALLAEGAPDPDSWLSDPLGPFRLADSLSRELHRSRPAVEEQLRRMASHLRRTRGIKAYGSAAVRTVSRELSRMSGALASNADPRLVLLYAALRVQQLEAFSPRTRP